MKNLKKAELIVIALTLLCLFFTAGYFVGRGASVEVISFEKLAPASASVSFISAGGSETATGSHGAVSPASPVLDTADQESSGTTPPSGGQTPSVATGTNQPDKTNINTASQSRLEELPGIGPVLARSIIDYRDENGGFSSIEQIMDVKGIGEKKYAAIKDMITIGNG